jgi:hypothetical protein
MLQVWLLCITAKCALTSQMGQKRRSRLVRRMSAYPPIAAEEQKSLNRRFGPNNGRPGDALAVALTVVREDGVRGSRISEILPPPVLPRVRKTSQTSMSAARRSEVTRWAAAAAIRHRCSISSLVVSSGGGEAPACSGVGLVVQRFAIEPGMMVTRSTSATVG